MIYLHIACHRSLKLTITMSTPQNHSGLQRMWRAMRWSMSKRWRGLEDCQSGKVLKLGLEHSLIPSSPLIELLYQPQLLQFRLFGLSFGVPVCDLAHHASKSLVWILHGTQH